MPTLPLNDIVNVIVSINPVATVRAGFNLGLVIGTSNVISAADRIKTYTDLASMIEDGFAITDPEYKAATLYFSQTPRPTRVAIGRWDNTGQETLVQAVTACRVKNTDWYVCTVCGADKTEISAVSAYIETAVPASVFFYTTADADVKSGTEGNIMSVLQDLKYKRTLGQYSTINDAVAAIMGYAMGANTELANSAYALAYKKEVGVTPEALSDTEVNSIKNLNGNVYITRGLTYNLFEQGVMADGTPFDELLNLDIITDDIQKSVMDALASYPKVPQTEDGVSILISAITGPCDKARIRGFLAPGVWNAPSILSLNTGDTLSTGYLILADSMVNQSQEDRDARKSPPIYVAVKLAGAIEHVLINVLVNR